MDASLIVARRSVLRTVVFLSAVTALSLCLNGTFAIAKEAAGEFSVEPIKAEFIKPGTVLNGGTDLKGWSHVIIKSYPRATLGDVDKVGKIDVELASAFFTVVAVNMEEEDEKGGAKLARLGVGVGTKIGKEETIVSPDTQRKLGANLGFFARIVLDGFYEEQKNIRVVAQGKNAWIIDTPVIARIADKNGPAVVRYMLLQDEKGKELKTACWLLGAGTAKNRLGVQGPVEWLPLGKKIEPELYVDKDEYVLGVATKQAFAISVGPQGDREMSIDEELSPIYGRVKLTPSDAAAIYDSLTANLRLARLSSEESPASR